MLQFLPLWHVTCAFALAALAGARIGARADASPAQTLEPCAIGMSTALSGPAADLGLEMRAGVELAFAEIDRDGGVRGRALELRVVDDGYEPSRTAQVMRELVNDDDVVAIVGNVGTPTAVAALPIVNDSGIAFFGAFTGADVLRKTPPDPTVFNVRASYFEETAAMVDALVSIAHVRVDEIALFTQRDAYGDSGYRGALEALRRAGMPENARPPHGRYERNTNNVEDGLAEILLARPMPRAVIMVGTYEPCAKFIQLAHDVGLSAVFLNVSFVGADSLARRLGAAGDGVVVTQVVPHPASELPLVREYRAALGALAPEHAPSFGSLEGYVAGRVLIRALRDSELPLTRANVPRMLADLGSFDIGLGEPLELGAQQHQACHRVWPTLIRGACLRSIEWSELAALFAALPR